MTAYSELKLRRRAQSHDITDPSATVTGQDVAERAYASQVLEIPIVADALAATTTGERPIVAVPAAQYPNGAKVVAIDLRHDTAVVEDDADYATDTFTNRDSAGINNLEVAVLTTETVAAGGIGTTIAQKRVSITLSATAANLVIPAGGCLTFTRAKTGATGVAVPDCLYSVTIEAL